jgi:transposase
MREERISVGSKEQKRAQALNRLLAGEWTEGETAAALGLSIRQVRRLKRAYREEGISSLIHGNRGRRPHHALSSELRNRVATLARTTYAGCNDHHLGELLAEHEDIELSRSSIRRILREAGIASPRKRRAPKHRSRRERMPQEGMLLQIDGSRHDWLAGRGPYLTLIGAIDDATGTAPYALFRQQEDAHGYFLLLEHIVLQHGRPLALYHDRHGIFAHSTKGRVTVAERVTGRPDPTQFGRLLQELDIQSIPARSPQAKGRVERFWGTLQDRLVAELRLAGAATIDEANQVLWNFLPRFNQHFAVPPAAPGVAYQPLEIQRLPEELFCFKYERTVAADNTVQLGEHRVQLLSGPDRLSYAKARVEVHERMDGALAVYYRGRRLRTTAAPLEAPVLRARDGRLGITKSPAPEPGLHPLSWEEINRRSRAATIEPGSVHPWRRPWPLGHHPTNGGQNH